MSGSSAPRDLDAAEHGLTNDEALVLRIAYLAVQRTGRYPEYDQLKAMVNLDNQAYFVATYSLRRKGLFAWRNGLPPNVGPHGFTRRGALLAAKLAS